jgi:hypothetical protein
VEGGSGRIGEGRGGEGEERAGEGWGETFHGAPSFHQGVQYSGWGILLVARVWRVLMFLEKA